MKKTFAAWFSYSLLFAIAARAFQTPQTPELPNFDKRLPILAPAVAANPTVLAAAARLRSRVPGARIHRGDGPGRPQWIFSSRGFLSGPNGEGRGVSLAAARALPANDPHRAVKAFLNDHAGLFGHGAEALTGARLQREFVTPHNGLRSAVWEQQLDNVPVFEGVLLSHVMKDGELVSLASAFTPDAEKAANRAAPNRAALLNAPPVSAKSAIARAAAEIRENAGEGQVNELPGAADAHGYRSFSAPGLNGDTNARFVWLPMSDGSLRLCWEIILTSRSRGEMFRVLIDAQTGEALVRHSLTAYISNATYRVFTSDSPTPFSPGWPAPNPAQPPVGSRSLVVTNAANTNASPNGWINDNNNDTRGNNVSAHTDRNADDVADTPRPTGSPARVFDFPLDFTQSPTNSASASVVQLFYWCNWMHDKLYELGFTEAAGNFQANNFGRGGLGADALLADAQDGSGVNNANMTVHPADGRQPRMQMFLWTTPTPARDAALDAEIILHEYTHGLSGRRVGGGVGLSALQTLGLGEGWSDFYALALLSEPGDDVNGNYAAGAYSAHLLGGTAENYYYGIRRYPYSADLGKNPLTFKDIDPAQASLHPGVPRNPANTNGAAQIHNQGELWCATLWQARAGLINKHGFAAGNQLILQLVTDGMNLAPPNPTFLQARDAILLADRVNHGGTNQAELWHAFARRGLGYSAVGPPNYTTTGVREAFDLPDDLLVLPETDLAFRGPAGGPFTPLAQTYSLANTGSNALYWSAAPAASWVTLSPDQGNLPPGSPAATLTVQINPAAAALPAGLHTNVITLTDQTTGRSVTRLVALGLGLTNPLVELFDEGEFDLSNTALTFTPDGSADFYSVCREPAALFSTDPTGGTQIGMDDDNFAPISIGGTTVSLFGLRTNLFFIGSNGYLTFGDGDGDPTPGSIFTRPRIAALMNDLDPRTGNVSVKVMGDRVAVTFRNVPQSGRTNSNNFQFELFTNGVIRVTWLRMDTRAGAVGLSRGNGFPSPFIESDLSAVPPCATRRVALFDARLATESCTLSNRVIDPGETVALNFALINAGGLDLGNIVVALQEGGGVTAPSGPRTYKTLISGGSAVTNTFTFTANGPCGGTLVATFVVQDGTNILATVPLTFDLGVVRRFTAFFVKNSPIPIPALGAATPYPSSNVVSGLPGLVTKVTISLSGLLHPSPEDLDVLLVGPAGQKTLLMSKCGGPLAANNVFLTFDDAASAALPDAGPITPGTFRPTSFGSFVSLSAPAPSSPYVTNFSVFNGGNPNGAWQLFIEDRVSGNGGSISSGWTLNLNTADATCCLDPASTDLSLAMANAPGPAQVDREVVYALIVTNRGPGVAAAVTMANPLPPNVVLVSARASQGACVQIGGDLVCDLGPLASNATATAMVTLRPALVGLLTNSARVTSGTLDYNTGNNAAQSITAILAPLALVNPVLTPAGFQFSIRTEVGRTYHPEFKNSLDDPSWQQLPPLLGDGSVVTVIDPLPLPLPRQRFYRVRIE